jgi:hypothetical protein
VLHAHELYPTVLQIIVSFTADQPTIEMTFRKKALSPFTWFSHPFSHSSSHPFSNPSFSLSAYPSYSPFFQPLSQTSSHTSSHPSGLSPVTSHPFLVFAVPASHHVLSPKRKRNAIVSCVLSGLGGRSGQLDKLYDSTLLANAQPKSLSSVKAFSPQQNLRPIHTCSPHNSNLLIFSRKYACPPLQSP